MSTLIIYTVVYVSWINYTLTTTSLNQDPFIFIIFGDFEVKSE